MTTLDDYIARVTFQLASVNWPGTMPQQVLQSWDKVAEELRDNSKFGRQLNGDRSIRKQVEALIHDKSDTLKIIENIYDFIRNSVVWDERLGAFVESDLADVLKKKSGSAPEINLLLTLMLREAGVKDIHCHDLRHTFASRLRMKGTPLENIADLLGHRSQVITNRYAHMGPSHLQDEAVARLTRESTDNSTSAEEIGHPDATDQAYEK